MFRMIHEYSNHFLNIHGDCYAGLLEWYVPEPMNSGTWPSGLISVSWHSILGISYCSSFVFSLNAFYGIYILLYISNTLFSYNSPRVFSYVFSYFTFSRRVWFLFIYFYNCAYLLVVICYICMQWCFCVISRRLLESINVNKISGLLPLNHVFCFTMLMA